MRRAMSWIEDRHAGMQGNNFDSARDNRQSYGSPNWRLGSICSREAGCWPISLYVATPREQVSTHGDSAIGRHGLLGGRRKHALETIEVIVATHLSAHARQAAGPYPCTSLPRVSGYRPMAIQQSVATGCWADVVSMRLRRLT
jgi:hypothetical protein